MKQLMSVVIATLSLTAAPMTPAVEEHHPDQKGAPAKTTPKDAKAPMAKGMPMGMMQDKMLKMHEQMHKIMQAKDPKERDKLMQEHMQMMQEHMKMMGGGMGGMMGGDGKGGMMGPGMMGGDGKGGKMGAPAGK
ncbi:MAG: hypothetical protein HY083_00690 [Gammaproteobacteria bacterium]|nr:hypothetical protein [Gammaproteobacteria bacterium]